MLCTWLSENEFKNFSHVSDEDIEEVFQMVREIEPIWFIDERIDTISRLFRKPKTETTYTIYQVYTVNNTSSYPEVRIQMSVSTKRDCLNFLYGLNIGYHKDIDKASGNNL